MSKNSAGFFAPAIVIAVLTLVFTGCSSPVTNTHDTSTGTSTGTGTGTGTVTGIILPAPKNLRAEAGTNSSGNPTVSLTWTPVSGAAYYAVYQSTDSTWSDYIIISSSTTNTTYLVPYYTNDPPLKNNTTYYYKVGAKKNYTSDPVGTLTEAVTVYIGLAGSTSVSVSALSDSSIKITWNAVTGASKYQVYRGSNYSASSMEAVAYVNAPATEYTDTSLASSTNYYYRVAAIDSENREGPLSSGYGSAVTHTAPTVTGISANALSVSSIKVTWNAFTGASKYRVYRAVNTSSSTSMEAVAYVDAPATEYTDTSLDPGTTYYYRIAVIYSDNREGSLSGVYHYASTRSSISSLAPANLTATPHGRVITLQWEAVEGANNYCIYIAFSEAGPYVLIDDYIYGTAYNVSSVTQYSSVPLAANTTYYFKVSVGSSGKMSTAVSATTGA